MKKNVFMRAALLLLVLTLITSCFVGGTFAKYTTSGGPNGDSARVAKWGVQVVAVSDNIFDATYATDEEDGYTGDLTVSASVDVVAPGTTKADLTDLTLTGNPEVAARVTYSAVLTLTGWEVNSAEYCPIIFTVEGTEYKIGSGDIDNVSELITAVQNAIAACSKDYAPGTNLAAAASTTDAPTVSWSWPFSTGADNDAKDTVLGDAGTATISLNISVLIEQID